MDIPAAWKFINENSPGVSLIVLGLVAFFQFSFKAKLTEVEGRKEAELEELRTQLRLVEDDRMRLRDLLDEPRQKAAERIVSYSHNLARGIRSAATFDPKKRARSSEVTAIQSVLMTLEGEVGHLKSTIASYSHLFPGRSHQKLRNLDRLRHELRGGLTA